MPTAKKSPKVTLDADLLLSLIVRADPQQAALRFKSHGACKNEGVFHFCQLIKSHGVKWQDAEPYLLAWYNHWSKLLVGESGRWQFEEIMIFAEDLWPKIRFCAGDLLKNAIDRAYRRLEDNEIIPELDGYGTESENLLALLCYELSELQKSKPFFITERDAAEVLGLDREGGRRKARMVLRVFCKKGIMILTARGNQVKATRFRWLGSCPLCVPEEDR